MAILSVGGLCPPAQAYLGLSLVGMFFFFFTAYDASQQFCDKSIGCNIGNTSFMMVVKLLFVLLYTWMLNLLCNRVSPWASWVLVLLPFVYVALYMLYWEVPTLARQASYKVASIGK